MKKKNCTRISTLNYSRNVRKNVSKERKPKKMKSTVFFSKSRLVQKASTRKL